MRMSMIFIAFLSLYCTALWAVEPEPILSIQTGHKGSITAMSFTPEETLLLSVAKKTSAEENTTYYQATSLPDGAVEEDWTSTSTSGLAIAVHPSGQVVALSQHWDGQGEIVIQDPYGKVIQTLKTRIFAPEQLAYSPQGNLLAARRLASLQLYSVPDYKLVATYRHENNAVLSMAFSSDGTKLAAAFRGGRLEIIGTANLPREAGPDGQPREAPPPILTKELGSSILAMAFSPSGKTLAGADDRHNQILLLDPENGTLQRKLYGIAQEPKALIFVSNQLLWVVDGVRATLWNLETGNNMDPLYTGDAGLLETATLSRTGRTLALAHDKGIIRLYAMDALRKAYQARLDREAEEFKRMLDGTPAQVRQESPSDGKKKKWGKKDKIEIIPVGICLPDQGRALHEQAMAAYQAKDYAQAAQKFTQVALANPKHSDSYMMLGAAQFEMRDLDNAAINQKRALALDPKNHNALFMLARVLGRLGNIPEQKRFLQRALAVAPDAQAMSQDLILLASAFYNEKGYSAARCLAETLLEQPLSNQRQEAELLFMSAKVLIRHKQEALGIEGIQSAISKGLVDPWTSYWIALGYYNQNDYVHARSHIDKFLEQKPESEDGLILKGSVFLMLGQPDQARSDWTKAAKAGSAKAAQLLKTLPTK